MPLMPLIATADRQAVGAAVLLALLACKFGTAYPLLRCAGYPRRPAAILATLLTDRGLLGLDLLDVARQIDALPPHLAAFLSLGVIATIVIVTPLLLLLAPGTELEEPLRRHGWLPDQSKSS